MAKSSKSGKTASDIYNKALSLGERRNWALRHDTSETWLVKKCKRIILSSFSAQLCYVYFRKLYIRVNVAFTPVFNIAGFVIRSIVVLSRNLRLHWLIAFVRDVSVSTSRHSNR